MVRSPDGHMIGLFEPGDASVSMSSSEEEGNRPSPPSSPQQSQAKGGNERKGKK